MVGVRRADRDLAFYAKLACCPDLNVFPNRRAKPFVQKDAELRWTIAEEVAYDHSCKSTFPCLGWSCEGESALLALAGGGEHAARRAAARSTRAACDRVQRHSALRHFPSRAAGQKTPNIALHVYVQSLGVHI